MSGLIKFSCLLLVFLAAGTCAALPEVQRPPLDLTALSLEELMDLEVTLASRKPEKLSTVAAAIAVVTGEDIHRAGVTSLPEALRLVPGVQVARLDANKWAVSVRGFNSRFADKLLVLIDGRSIYDPIFSGVYWDMHEVMLEDVERIEVIRGPGAALWGANAVDGIINVVTRNSRDAQGGLLVSGLGSQERGLAGFRYGGRLAENLYGRVYGKYFARDHFATTSGAPAADGWSFLRGGFRLDGQPSARDQVSLQGELFDGELDQSYSFSTSLDSLSTRVFPSRTPISGGHLLGRWERALGEGADMALQLYYDQNSRQEVVLAEEVDLLDLDFQHSFAAGRTQDFTWGLGYRLTRDQTRGGNTVWFVPTDRTYALFSGFAQDEFGLVRDRVHLTLGTKLEHNEYTGFEVQPNVRLCWQPSAHHLGWAALSRAVRMPARGDHDVQVRIDPGLTRPDLASGRGMLVAISGNRDFAAEELLAAELGYRVWPRVRCFFDLALFYNRYDRLRSLAPGPAFVEEEPPPGHLVLPFQASNGMEGKTWGAELAAEWHPAGSWRLGAAYTYLQMHLRSPDPLAVGGAEGQSPRHQLALHSSLDLPAGVELNLAGRYVGALPYLRIDRYFSADARLGWRLPGGFELSLAGRDLLAAHHLEFRSESTTVPPIEVERSWYGSVQWRL